MQTLFKKNCQKHLNRQCRYFHISTKFGQNFFSEKVLSIFKFFQKSEKNFETNFFQFSTIHLPLSPFVHNTTRHTHTHTHPHPHVCAHIYIHRHQCDQIGRFFKVLGDKISNKSSPNYWQLFGLF